MDAEDSNNKNETPSCSAGTESPTKDKLFDPSIDMLVNDFDDERTLEEEEAMAADEASDPSTELSNLEKEGNMPLEELLILYGYNSKNKESSSECEEEEEEEEEEVEEQQPMELEQICEPIVEKESSPSNPHQSKLSLLYEPIADDIDDSRNLASVSRISDDDEEEEAESNPDDEEYQKFPSGIHTIMVGNDYQAQVPDGLISYDQVPANDAEDTLLWSSEPVHSQEVENYLRRAHEILKPTIPKGILLRDDEEALYLLQECNYNTAEALRKLELRGPSSPQITNGHDAKWSEDECRNFEAGVRSFGKDFLQIQQNKVPTRTVGELVQFYYLWKKTERHDIFANRCRLDKLKYSFHPGLTDFMDRFLEDQETDKNASASTGGHIYDGT